MITLYSTPPSGSCHKVRLFLSILKLPHQIIDIDFNGGEHRRSEFMKLNPFGEIPVLIDDNIVLRDSQSILVYLARRYADEGWLPIAAEPMARVTQWLGVAANEIQNGPNLARRALVFKRSFDIARAQAIAQNILRLMDDHLTSRSWLETERPTVADIACYPYIAAAPEGAVSLRPYTAVRAWLTRIEKLPGYVPLSCSPLETVSLPDRNESSEDVRR